jgi:hypothetical protein
VGFSLLPQHLISQHLINRRVTLLPLIGVIHSACLFQLFATDSVSRYELREVRWNILEQAFKA